MPRRTKAAVLWGVGEPWSIEDVELDDPHAGDVLVRMRVAGLCHSDEHAVTGDLPLPLPAIGGHEGSGIVESVGPGVTSVAPGDHVAVSFVPSCGRCRWCAGGMGYICDDGAKLFDVGMMSDGREAHHAKGHAVGRYAQVGTFAEYVLCSENSVVRAEKDLSFEALALVSCGVGTGVGSATNRAGTRPGDTVAVIGIGGIGINAIQGARVAGAARVIGIDPVPFKREKAMEFGATHTYSSVEEAMSAVPELTWGVMCERVILSTGVVTGDLLDPALNLTAKGGTLVVTGLAPMMQQDVNLNLFMLAMLNKEVKGTIFGSGIPREVIPRLLTLYREGVLKIDELVTARYSLADVNQGYQDMRDGKNLRGILVFD